VLLKNWSFKNNTYFKRKAPTLLGWCFAFLSIYSNAQINLVQNPSFEKIFLCPNMQSQIKYANFWDTLKVGGGGTPDLYNVCNTNIVGVPNNILSFQYPKSGLSYAGIISYYKTTQITREYIQNKLVKKLIANQAYCVTMHVNLADISTIAIDRIGIYFDDGNIYASYYNIPNSINHQIQSPSGTFIKDTLNWTKIQGSFIANGTEQYLTIGNYFSDLQTNTITVSNNNIIYSYYNIDDVSVIDYNTKAYAGQDAVVCLGDSIYIGRQPEIGLECQWFNNTIQIADGAGIWVKPNTNQQYIIKQDVCGITSYDTVQVTIKDIYCNLILNSEIPNAFTPNADGINDVWQFTLGSGITLNGFDIYNRWGNLIKNLELSTSNIITWDGRTTSGEPCSDGVYFYVLNYANSKGEQQNKKGYISLFK
jgi:gliding motility-associated-like protein